MSREILIKDNFLPNSFFRELKDNITSSETEWKFKDNATYPRTLSERLNIENDQYFSHVAYHSVTQTISPQFQVVRPILYFIEDRYKFEITNLLRIHYTFMTERKQNFVSPDHLDFNAPHYVAILYMNTCNGPTMIEDKKVDFIENRMVMFDGTMRHSAVSQTDSYHRLNVVVNIQGNFKV